MTPTAETGCEERQESDREGPSALLSSKGGNCASAAGRFDDELGALFFASRRRVGVRTGLRRSFAVARGVGGRAAGAGVGATGRSDGGGDELPISGARQAGVRV